MFAELALLLTDSCATGIPGSDVTDGPKFEVAAYTIIDWNPLNVLSTYDPSQLTFSQNGIDITFSPVGKVGASTITDVPVTVTLLTWLNTDTVFPSAATAFN